MQLDENFADAYGKLAFYHALSYHYRLDRTKDRLVQSKKSYEKAISIDSTNLISRQGRGYYHYYANMNYYRAINDFEYAMRIEPGNSEHIYNVALIQRRLGLWNLSTKNFKLALKVNPGS